MVAGQYQNTTNQSELEAKHSVFSHTLTSQIGFSSFKKSVRFSARKACYVRDALPIFVNSKVQSEQQSTQLTKASEIKTNIEEQSH